MLRTCALDFSDNWDRLVKLMEFSYNNSYHSRIGMVPFEVLYGWKCRFFLYWGEVGEKLITGPDLVKRTVEKIKMIRKRLKVAEDRSESGAESKRRPLELQPGKKNVYLKVSPTKEVMRFGKSSKLSPRYLGPYEVLDRVGLLAYWLALPLALSRIHNVFHVSQLRKYVSDPSHIL